MYKIRMHKILLFLNNNNNNNKLLIFSIIIIMINKHNRIQIKTNKRKNRD